MAQPHTPLDRSLTQDRSSRGFTLVEMMITLIVVSVVMVVVAAVMYSASRSKVATAGSADASQAARAATDMIARDLRSAGYGTDLDYSTLPQPPIAYVDSLQVLMNENLQPYPDSSAVRGWPLAYRPDGTPKPFPLNGTSWTPPIRYRTGAEVVRWTMDVNNDGVVNSADVSAAAGIDARRSPNPNDYVLVRQIFGDSTNATSGNNGGTAERVALISKPGGSVPPLFTVYMKGSSTPYNWSSGPVPASQLANISRVVIQVTAPSSKPDSKGNYVETRYKTEVSSLRNVPNFGAQLFNVTGFVYNDQDEDDVKDAGEPGLSGASIYLGVYNATTTATGSFVVQVPQGTYTLRHAAPPGYGVHTDPDSFVVSVPPAASRSFGDTARAGGWVNAYTYEDKNYNGVQNAGEPRLRYVPVSISPTGQIAYTDTSGHAMLFADVGGYSVTCTPLDSFVVSSTNPVTGSMSNGGSASVSFGLTKMGIGTIQGKVYDDKNKNGADDGDKGIQNVWVGVTPDGGLTIKGYGYTDANGAFSIDVGINDPPHTTAYSVMVIPPPGFYPTSATNIGGVWIQLGQTLTGYEFGMSSFQVITLNASRVLSLGSANLVEKDWKSGNYTNGVKDADIVLGADANGTDQVSVWFNQYSVSPLFDAAPSYTRSAPNAVMAVALDTLNKDNERRPDLVTGTKLSPSSNFFVWFNQTSNGNEGYFPATPDRSYGTNDNGDVQAIATMNCSSADSAGWVDIIVGTKSPTANQGTLEVWRNVTSGSSTTFALEEIYPPTGGFPLGGLGEVTSMALADFDGDGNRDLAVGTSTGAPSGQVVLLKFLSPWVSPHFYYMGAVTIGSSAVTSLVATDVDGDGYKDIIVGTQKNSSQGELMYFRNTTPSLFDFQLQTKIDAPGIVQSLVVADLGGTSRGDLAVGYRQDAASYGGGLRIYYLDGGNLPGSGTDPSAGAISNMVPAMTSSNFNYGVPVPSAPYLSDLAAGIKSGPTTGALVVFIR